MQTEADEKIAQLRAALPTAASSSSLAAEGASRRLRPTPQPKPNPNTNPNTNPNPNPNANPNQGRDVSPEPRTVAGASRLGLG